MEDATNNFDPANLVAEGSHGQVQIKKLCCARFYVFCTHTSNTRMDVGAPPCTWCSSPFSATACGGASPQQNIWIPAQCEVKMEFGTSRDNVLGALNSSGTHAACSYKVFWFLCNKNHEKIGNIFLLNKLSMFRCKVKAKYENDTKDVKILHLQSHKG